MNYKILRTTEDILPSIQVVNDRAYYCSDTGNLYFDTKVGRIPQQHILIRTELERKSMKNPSIGYYYVFETNTVWIFNESKWHIYIKNEDNRYPSEYTDSNTNSKLVFADSLSLLVNRDRNCVGSLLINPVSSVEVTDYEDDGDGSYKVGNTKGVIRSHEFGKMIFNGDIYLCKSGVTRKIGDDGCIDEDIDMHDINIGDPVNVTVETIEEMHEHTEVGYYYVISTEETYYYNGTEYVLQNNEQVTEIETEQERQSITNPSQGYYHVQDTDIMWCYSGTEWWYQENGEWKLDGDE